MLGFLLVAVTTPEMGENWVWSGDLLIYRVDGGGDDPHYWNNSQILMFLCHSAPLTLHTPQKTLHSPPSLYLGSISYPFASKKLRT